MVHIQWKDRYRIGFGEIDAQHRGLLEVLNEVIDLVGQRGDPEVVSDLFRRLCAYAGEHFSTEEAYMEAHGYPWLAEHRQEHQSFIVRLLALNEAYDPEDPHLLEEVEAFLRQWYVDHILHSDMKYLPFLLGHGHPPQGEGH